ncbi:S8 family peptidase [Clostridium sp.]|uniref:S8 family peptidase n=1 Tax=Clostridium sp. TaxID=1506 RepID=UPI00321692F7
MKRNLEVPESIFSDVNYDHYIVQYQGNVLQDFSQTPDHYLTLINDRYAIISLPKNVELGIGAPEFPSIVYVKPTEMYTLQQVTPIEASQVGFLQLDLPLSLNGSGVNIAIIDTGIDYLSEEFMRNNGETRIECIWDQTIPSNGKNSDHFIPYGSIYEKEDIQSAIQAAREGMSPYDIVPTVDEIGHGTNMAGIVGAAGKNPELKGIAPNCDFVIVKLIQDFSYKTQFNVKVPIYNITTIFAALEFLYRYSLDTSKPMVILFPLGTNLGNHRGTGILEQYIESISQNSGIVIVVPTGNQRDVGCHTSGILSEPGELHIVEIDVSPEQNNLWMDIWVDSPNIMSVDIVSPSGENSGIISALINNTEYYDYIFEETSIKVNYYLPEEITGDELIRLRFYNIQSGIWKLRLIANSVLKGNFNAWIPEEGLTVGGTHFSYSDPFGTSTNPSNSPYVISVAAYNQNNNYLLNYSGAAFNDLRFNYVDIAAGGVNAITVAPNNKIATVNGTSVAAAVTAGACVLLFEWGIIKLNDPYMYSQTMKTYIARGADKRLGDIYPNPQWGYGLLNILQMFQNMI